MSTNCANYKNAELERMKQKTIVLVNFLDSIETVEFTTAIGHNRTFEEGPFSEELMKMIIEISKKPDDVFYKEAKDALKML